MKAARPAKAGVWIIGGAILGGLIGGPGWAVVGLVAGMVIAAMLAYRNGKNVAGD